MTVRGNRVYQMARAHEPAVTPELVQTLPSTTQRALGTQLMFLLEFAYGEDRMVSNSVNLGCEIRRRTTHCL